MTDASNNEVWSEDFSDPTGGGVWWGPHLGSAGCAGDPDSAGSGLILGGHMELLGSNFALQAMVGSGNGGIPNDGTHSTISIEATMMGDWLQPVATDHDVAILVCSSGGRDTVWTYRRW